MDTNKKSGVALALLALAAPAAWAQVAYVRPAYEFPSGPAQGPASIQLGETPVFATPYLGFGAGHDDNLFLSNTNRKSSTLYVVSPGLKLEARDPNKVIQFNYQGQYGHYTQSSEDNYVDHNANVQFDMAVDRRNFFRLGYLYVRSHDPRGSTDRPISTDPDKFRLDGPSAAYTFGTPGARGRIELYYSNLEREYLNNRQFTMLSDRRTQEYGGIFYLRVMPKTSLLAEARHTDIDYKLSSSPLDSREDRIYAGVTWEATAATTGTLKYGRLEKKFDQSFSTERTSSWEALVTWRPLTYSRFDFYSARQTNESTGVGSFILTSVAGVTWTHAWNSVFSTGVDARYTKDEFQNATRVDETKSLGFRAGYKFRRWLTLGAEYTHTRRDSNQSIFEYDKNLYLLTATASM
jgi:hypothetical protein